MTKQDDLILLDNLFTNITEYGKLPISETELRNKYTNNELANVLTEYMIDSNLVLEANVDFSNEIKEEHK
ncbi:hypothetical protein NVP1084O_043 [Vibrio phage 1.084.O._10N.261.49.F5]|nr:hypothetical protein NVP1084O_043 [Vibrio phage 1.084.O._10N.261.49.F5]